MSQELQNQSEQEAPQEEDQCGAEEEPVEVVVGVLPGAEEDSATEGGEEVVGEVEAVASIRVEEGAEAVTQISRELVASVEDGDKST